MRPWSSTPLDDPFSLSPRRPRGGDVRYIDAGCLAVVLACMLAGSGCVTSPRVADRNGDGVITAYCLGDSNTDVGSANTPKWCELLAQELPAWKFVNGGFARAKAGGDCFLCGKRLLSSALESTPIDVVLIALGTNDWDKPPEAVVSSLIALREQAEQKNAEVFVATIPPVFKQDRERVQRIEAVNDLIAQRTATDHVIDFFGGMETGDYFPDGVHIAESGQRKRAAAALRALRDQ